MFIAPLTKIDSIEQLSKVNQTVVPTSSVNLPFQSMFENALSDVKSTNANLENEVYKLTTGQTNNLHDLTIASTKANLSVELLVQLRNKALDAYNEVMRMGI